jgi:predicted RNA-binding protein with PUA-like domain
MPHSPKAPAHPGRANGDLRNAWLFQSNPDLYDIRGALRSLKEQVWSVRRFADEIRVGDPVYIWESGRHGGIVGLAEISEPARLLPEPEEQLPFAKDPAAFAGYRLRARLKVVKVVEPVIARQYIVSRYDLASMTVLLYPRGTNFRLSGQQARELNELFHKTAAA